MDAINDYYMEELDLSAMKRFFLEQGERRACKGEPWRGCMQKRNASAVPVAFLERCGSIRRKFHDVVGFIRYLWQLQRHTGFCFCETYGRLVLE